MTTVHVTPTLPLQMPSYDNCHRGNGHNNDDSNYLDRQLLQDVHVASRQTLDSIHDSSKYTDAGVNRISNSILADSNAQAAAAVAGNERLQNSLRDTVEKQSNANRDAVERTGLASTTTSEKVGNQLSAAVERNGTANALGIEKIGGVNIANQERVAGAASTQQERISGAATVQQERIAGAASVQQERIASENRNTAYQHHNASALASKDIQLDMFKIKCDSEALAYKNSASIELELCKAKDTLSMQLAKCCCEIKGKIGEEAKNTQQLVQTLDNNRVRDSLNAANTENLVLRMQNGNGRS